MPTAFPSPTPAEASRVFADALAGQQIAVLPGAGVDHLTAYPLSSWRGAGSAGSADSPGDGGMAGAASAPPALVVFTSGSTGKPKGVALSAEALQASAAATEDALCGPGRWFLCLAPDHIAGAQVILRSLRSGTVPFDGRGHFTAERFADQAEEFLGPGQSEPAYASLVPTQLTRILRDPRATGQAARFDALLVGGASLHPHTAQAAKEAGLRIVRTYGMSETGGGCVYDGHAFPQVDVRIESDGRVALSGPVVADGYVEVGPDSITPKPDSSFSVDTSGRRTFLTSDMGRLDSAGVLSITGRVDDVFQSGGTNVSPLAVESVLLSELADDGIDEVLLVPVEDSEWGHLGALLVRGPGAEYYRNSAVALKTRFRHLLGPAEIPRWVFPVEVIPTKGIGKPDRAAARALAARLLRGDAEPGAAQDGLADVTAEATGRAEVRPTGAKEADLAGSAPGMIQDSTDTRTDERGE